jgi:hypothetical protein
MQTARLIIEVTIPFEYPPARNEFSFCQHLRIAGTKMLQIKPKSAFGNAPTKSELARERQERAESCLWCVPQQTSTLSPERPIDLDILAEKKSLAFLQAPRQWRRKSRRASKVKRAGTEAKIRSRHASVQLRRCLLSL